jgi:hypothetical protein
MASAAANSVALATDYLSDELGRLRVAAPAMTPGASTAVRSVLETILSEENLDPTVASDLRATLDALFGRSMPTALKRPTRLSVRPALRVV